jgi:hypothetical protein
MPTRLKEQMMFSTIATIRAGKCWAEQRPTCDATVRPMGQHEAIINDKGNPALTPLW